jgi:hypothetical protein
MTVVQSQYHQPTWYAIQIRTLALGRWKLTDLVPRRAYVRVHEYVAWVLEHHAETGLPMSACLLMHPIESLLWLDKSRWCRAAPWPTWPTWPTWPSRQDSDPDETIKEAADNSNGMVSFLQTLRMVPIPLRALLVYLNPTQTISMSDQTMATILDIIDMIITDAVYAASYDQDTGFIQPITLSHEFSQNQ